MDLELDLTVNDLGLLCEQSGFPEPDIITRMNEKVNFASEILETTYASFDKGITLSQPFYYETTMQLICDVSPIPDAYVPFWYHPDHLGSSSYITNLGGEINQHMEYLPFGELLVEEHLNSYNSPFKFNAKEFDAETGNYYYGARYYDPKWSIWLSVDPLATNAPSWTPYRFGFHNPVTFIDPNGLFETKAEAKEWAKENNIKTGFFRNHKIKEQNDGSWSIDNKRAGHTYYKDSSLDDFDVLGRGEDGVIKSALLSNKKYNHFNEMASDAWNTPQARSLIPDKISLSLSSSVTAFVGSNTDLSFNWITRGHDANAIPYVTFSAGGQVGGKVMADALMGIGIGYYTTNDIRNLQKGEASRNLLGWSFQGSAGIGYGIGGQIRGGVGITDPLNGNYRPTWVSGGVGLGPSIGGGASGGANYTFPVFKNQFK